jgi:lipopolysaccharide cholinephosphotransferase
MEMKHDMKAILGEDFFKAEVKCDYLIPSYMKSNWALQLDLYMTLAELCDKHGLRYYANSGMLLGAIRHNGFIPWDDDLDIAMPREDYNKLMEIAPKELEYPYFLRTPYTDPNCYYSSIALMNLETSFVPKIFKNKPFKKGVPIDIFPLDYCDPSRFDDDRSHIIEHIMRCMSWMKTGCDCLDELQMEKIIKYPTDNPLKEWEEIHRIASNPQYEESEYYAISVMTILRKEQSIYPVADFEKVIMWPFETIKVPVPVGYKDLLEIQYGEFMKYPPVEERGKKNDQIIFDPNRPYTFYMD